MYATVGISAMVTEKYNSAYLYVNGSMYNRVLNYASGTSGNIGTVTGAVMNLSAGDYVEVYVRQNTGSSQNCSGESGERRTFFGGFKLIS